MSNFIYYEKLEDYEEQVRKAKLCDEKDKEIEKLTAESTDWESKCYHYQDILNELEKDLKEKINEDRLNLLSNCHWKYVLDKLNELKGDSSNE